MTPGHRLQPWTPDRKTRLTAATKRALERLPRDLVRGGAPWRNRARAVLRDVVLAQLRKGELVSVSYVEDLVEMALGEALRAAAPPESLPLAVVSIMAWRASHTA